MPVPFDARVHPLHEPDRFEPQLKMWRAILHSYFMEGLTNRDGIAAICDAAYDELLWIDQNFPSKAKRE